MKCPTFYEPIETAAPPTARPYCCYLSTVIFYEGDSFRVLEEKQSAWNLLGTRWTAENLGWSSLAPFVRHEGQVYELVSGYVEWREGGWCHVWRGRLVDDGDPRLRSALAMERN